MGTCPPGQASSSGFFFKELFGSCVLLTFYSGDG